MSFAVLIISDDEVVSHFMEHVLRQSGFHVASAADATGAADRLVRSPYDAIILDCADPSSILRYLQLAFSSLIPKTVVATKRPRDAASAELRDICRVIVKPFDARLLLDAVSECLTPA